MAETAAQPARPVNGQQEAKWSQVWHLPVLLAGIGLFALGVYISMPEPERNDFPAALDEVAQYLQANNLEKAEQRLTTIKENINQASAANEARMWQYWGDLNYRQLRQEAPAAVRTQAGQETNEQIIHYYKQAEEAGRSLEPRSIRRYAQTLVALGRGEEALAMLDRLEDQPARQRYLIIRNLIEHHRATGASGDIAKLAPLVERFKSELRQESDAQRRREQQIWVAGLNARLRLEADAPQQAIDLLLRRISQLTLPEDPGSLAPLRVLLARAYQRIGELEEAERYYRYAQQQVPSNDALNADIHVGLGEIALASSEDLGVQRALDHFSQAARNFPSEPMYVDALIGQADCEARLDTHRDALEHFRQAVDRLVEKNNSADPRRTSLTQAVRTHIQRAHDEGQFERALNYLSLLKPLHRPELPADLLLDFAQAHDQIAQQHQARARAAEQAALRAGHTDNEEDDQQIMSRKARRLANQQAATHFANAGDYFLRHADAVSITDDDAHGQSLWKAAISFDKAQRWKNAIEVYSQYIQTRQTDSHYLEAINRLGEAYLADGQYQAAADLFMRLLDEHPKTLEAYESLVPLARARMGMGEPKKAEQRLLDVVTDHEAITPESAQYREALVELGKLYYRLGEQQPAAYVDAIERLSEAVSRYGHTPQGAELRYLLADSYRRSVKPLEKQIEQLQSQSERVERQAEKQRRLTEAQKFYNQVITELETRPEDTLSALHKLYLRNSYFYQADSAFDRGQFERAIALYDTAARRYEQHPASLVALVQIVNAHCELGQIQEARVANARARRQLQRIPEQAFENEAALPMERQHWEDWLRWNTDVLSQDEQPAGAQTRR